VQREATRIRYIGKDKTAEVGGQAVELGRTEVGEALKVAMGLKQ
jgi:hypothetical protein